MFSDNRQKNLTRAKWIIVTVILGTLCAVGMAVLRLPYAPKQEVISNEE